MCPADQTTAGTIVQAVITLIYVKALEWTDAINYGHSAAYS